MKYQGDKKQRFSAKIFNLKQVFFRKRKKILFKKFYLHEAVEKSAGCKTVCRDPLGSAKVIYLRALYSSTHQITRSQIHCIAFLPTIDHELRKCIKSLLYLCGIFFARLRGLYLSYLHQNIDDALFTIVSDN